MALPSVILVLATILSILYFVLAITAAANVKPNEKSSFWFPLLWLDPWWPYYQSKYLPSAKKQLFLGKVLLPFIIVVWVMWWQLKND